MIWKWYCTKQWPQKNYPFHAIFFCLVLRNIMLSAVIFVACHVELFLSVIHLSLLSIPYKFKTSFSHSDIPNLWSQDRILIVCAMLSFDWCCLLTDIAHFIHLTFPDRTSHLLVEKKIEEEGTYLIHFMWPALPWYHS